jgi:hypothetical protein
MKTLFLSSVITLSLIFFGCGNSAKQKQNDNVKPDTSKGVSAMSHDSLNKNEAGLVYVCPCGGCPEVKESKPGNCPKCGLELKEEKK